MPKNEQKFIALELEAIRLRQFQAFYGLDQGKVG